MNYLKTISEQIQIIIRGFISYLLLEDMKASDPMTICRRCNGTNVCLCCSPIHVKFTETEFSGVVIWEKSLTMYQEYEPSKCLKVWSNAIAKKFINYWYNNIKRPPYYYSSISCNVGAIRGIILLQLRKSIKETMTDVIAELVMFHINHIIYWNDLRVSNEELRNKLTEIIDDVLQPIRTIRKNRIDSIIQNLRSRRLRLGFESDEQTSYDEQKNYDEQTSSRDYLLAGEEVDTKLGYALYHRGPRRINYKLKEELISVVKFRPGGIGFSNAMKNFDTLLKSFVLI